MLPQMNTAPAVATAAVPTFQPLMCNPASIRWTTQHKSPPTLRYQSMPTIMTEPIDAYRETVSPPPMVAPLLISTSPDNFIISPNGTMSHRSHQHYKHVSPTSSYGSQSFTYPHVESVPVTTHYDLYDPFNHNVTQARISTHVPGQYYRPVHAHDLVHPPQSMPYPAQYHHPRTLHHTLLPAQSAPYPPYPHTLSAPSYSVPAPIYHNSNMYGAPGQFVQRSPPMVQHPGYYLPVHKPEELVSHVPLYKTEEVVAQQKYHAPPNIKMDAQPNIKMDAQPHVQTNEQHAYSQSTVNLTTGLEILRHMAESDSTQTSTISKVQNGSDSGLGSDISNHLSPIKQPSGTQNDNSKSDQVDTNDSGNASEISETPRSTILNNDMRGKLRKSLALSNNMPVLHDFAMAELRNPLPEIETTDFGIKSNLNDLSLFRAPIVQPLTSTPYISSSHVIHADHVKACSKNHVKRLSNGSKPEHRYLSQTASKLFNNWYNDNIDYPYPTQKQKLEFANLGNVSLRQVNAWFNNKRNRSNNTKPKRKHEKLEQRLAALCTELIQKNQSCPQYDQSLNYEDVKQHLHKAMRGGMDPNISCASSQLIVD